MFCLWKSELKSMAVNVNVNVCGGVGLRTGSKC